MAQLNFDANTVAPTQSLQALPAGWYQAKIIESELKPTRDGAGSYLQLTLEVLTPPHAGRKVTDRLNLQNRNPVAVEIAYGTLSAYCHATGVIQMTDSQQLHGIPINIRLSVRNDPTGQYEPNNEIKAIKHINEQVGDGGAPAAAATATPPPVGQPPAGFGATPTPAPAPAPAPAAAPAPGFTPPAGMAPAPAAPITQPGQPHIPAGAPAPGGVTSPQVDPATGEVPFDTSSNGNGQSPMPSAPAATAEQPVAASAPEQGSAVPPWAVSQQTS